MEQLNGILSFIDSVNLSNNKKAAEASEKAKGFKPSGSLNCNERVYRHFLFYKNFHMSKRPKIICEGKTDYIYLDCAIKGLADAHPGLAKKEDDGSIVLKVSFLKRSETIKRILGLTGGTGEFNKFITLLRREQKNIAVAGKKQPVILLVDNDDGAKRLYSYIKEIKKSPVDPKSQYIFITDNLYVVPTPLTPDGKGTTIEDFFEIGLKKTKLKGKTFNPSDKGFNPKTEYGKYLFAKLVVKKNQASINFSGFNPLLERIEAVLDDYKRKLS
jgi:hypothetical protein